MSFNMLPGLMGGNYGMQHPGQQPMPMMQRPMPALQPQAQQTMGGRVGGIFGDLMTRFQDMQQNNPQALMALASGLMQGNMGAGMAGAGDAMAQYRQQMAGQQEKQRQDSLTKRYLLSKGISEEEADAAAANPAILSDLLKRAAGGGQTEYGLNPIYGTDPETGEPVLGTLGKDGTFKKIDTGGVKLSTGVDKIDLGTHWGLLDKKSGQVVSTMPKENYQEAFDRGQGAAEGKARGEAAANLPTDLATAEQALKELDDLIKHPGINAIAGPFNQYRPSWTMSAEGRDALARFNQAKGRAFLQAFGMLKGGGQITEIEGLKAEQAMARMDRAQSEADFKTALQDFRDAVATGMEKIRQRAGLGTTIQAPGAAGGAASDPLGIRR
jgi:hypothetical protein